MKRRDDGGAPIEQRGLKSCQQKLVFRRDLEYTHLSDTKGILGPELENVQCSADRFCIMLDTESS